MINDLILAKTLGRVSAFAGALLIKAGVDHGMVANLFKDATDLAVNGNKELEDRLYALLKDVMDEKQAEDAGLASPVFKRKDLKSTNRHEDWD